MNIEINTINKQSGLELCLTYEQFLFNGGEVSVKLDKHNYNFITSAPFINITARLQNSDDFFYLANIKNALENIVKVPINLIMPYIPYARQDRVCDGGESFSLKVFCNLLNSLNCNKVTVFDPHSDVAPALINNVEIVSQFDIFNKNTDLIKTVIDNKYEFVSPDAGANKKTAKLAGFFNHYSFIRADKLRDLTNGNIKETIVYADNLKDKNLLIVDDICDGGRTFIELAKVLKAKGAKKIGLFVTHGIFANGLDVFWEAGIDKIYTLDSFKTNYVSHKKLDVTNIKKYLVC